MENMKSHPDMYKNPDMYKIYKRVALTVIVVAVLALGGLYWAGKIADSEYQRDIRNWEVRLGITHDIRVKAVENWVAEQQSELKSVADNLSLRIYLTELQNEEEINPDEEKSQITFIRNYLISTANRTGFTNPTAGDVNANVGKISVAGIALLNKDKNPLVMTDSMPDPYRDWGVVYLNEEGVPSMTFRVPVYPVQEENGEAIGYIVGVKPVDQWFSLLNFPASTEKTLESSLVRFVDGMAEYLSPVNGASPLTVRTNLDFPDYNVAFAMNNSGRFAIMNNYLGEEVLFIGSEIENTAWYLITEINSSEALAESRSRKNSIMAIGILSVMVLTVGAFALWRLAVSVRAERHAIMYKHIARKLKSNEMLLRLVTDNQSDPIFIVDREGIYRFANLSSSSSVRMKSEDMPGKNIANVVGTARAEEYMKSIQEALEKEAPVTITAKYNTEGGTTKTLQTKFIPLPHLSEIIPDAKKDGVLIVEQDITNAVRERERRERLLKDLVDSLVMLIDTRDANTANHSVRVSKIAEIIASQMALDEKVIETVGVAGKLMNLGKIMLPVSLLTKKDKLTPEEKNQLSTAMVSSADFLKRVEFDGPVVETIHQVQEKWDGSGPLGLEKEAIILPARILSLSNAYVAMTSPRSWRPAMSREDVIKTLMSEIDAKYERKVVVALLNFLENHGGSVLEELHSYV